MNGFSIYSYQAKNNKKFYVITFDYGIILVYRPQLLRIFYNLFIILMVICFYFVVGNVELQRISKSYTYYYHVINLCSLKT